MNDLKKCLFVIKIWPYSFIMHSIGILSLDYTDMCRFQRSKNNFIGWLFKLFYHSYFYFRHCTIIIARL